MEDKLNEHEKRITELEKNAIRFEDRMNNILEKLDNLINNLKWVAITSIGVMITVFIFVIEQNLK